MKSNNIVLITSIILVMAIFFEIFLSQEQSSASQMRAIESSKISEVESDKKEVEKEVEKEEPSFLEQEKSFVLKDWERISSVDISSELGDFSKLNPDKKGDCLYSLVFKYPLTEIALATQNIPSPLLVLENGKPLPVQKLDAKSCQGAVQFFKYQLKISPSEKANFSAENYKFAFQEDFPWKADGKDWYWLPKNSVTNVTLNTQKTGDEDILSIRIKLKRFTIVKRPSQFFVQKRSVLFQPVEGQEYNAIAQAEFPNEEASLVLGIRSFDHSLLHSIEIKVGEEWLSVFP